MIIYQFLDIFFIVFHTMFTLFCMTGWIWKKTRKLNLVLLLLTTASWFGIGYFCGRGIGYCVCTEWHWMVKIRLGQTNLPRSYIKYFADLVTGLDFDSMFIDVVVAVIYGIAMVCSIGINIRDLIINYRAHSSHETPG